MFRIKNILLSIEAKLSKVERQLADIEDRICTVEDKLQMHETRAVHIEARNITMEERMINTEGRLEIIDNGKLNEIIERLVHIEDKADVKSHNEPGGDIYLKLSKKNL